MSPSTTVLFAQDPYIRDWTALRPGDRILIDELSGHQQPGIVDEISESGEVLWIRYSQLNSRRLIHAAEIAGITCRAADIETPRLAALVRIPSNSM